jgi:hypothetical protein
LTPLFLVNTLIGIDIISFVFGFLNPFLLTLGQQLTAHIKETAEDLVPQRMKVILRSEY